MRIDKKLNLVIPIERDDGTTIFIHSTPIAREIFELYHLPIAKAFAAIHTKGLGYVSGPRISGLLLKQAAIEEGQWDGDGGVENGLLREIRRLTNVAMPGSSGWSMLPYETALQRDLLSIDDAAEVENALVYFTLASSMYPRKIIAEVLDGAGKLWGAQTTFSNSTEYIASLPSLTPAASTDQPTLVAGLSVPA